MSTDQALPASSPGTTVAAVWSDVLEIDGIGPEDNFFDLGGTSLTAIQVVARLREQFGYEVEVEDLFQAATVEQLAEVCSTSGARRPVDPEATEADDEAVGPLSPAQQRFWFFDQWAAGSPVSNLPVAVRLRGEVDAAALQQTIATLVDRHAVLRTRIDYAAGGLVQIVSPSVEWSLERLTLPSGVDGQGMIDTVRLLARKPLDLTVAPHFRAHLLDVGPRDAVLLLVFHHAAVDAWALGILMREASLVYAAARRGTGAELPPPGLTYVEYARRSRRTVAERTEAHLPYWREQLRDAPQLTLGDRPEHGGARFGGTTFWLSLESLAPGVRQVARTVSASTYMVLLAALARALDRCLDVRDVVFGVPVAGRAELATENLVGCLMDVMPLRLRVDPSATSSELVASVRDAVLEATRRRLPLDVLAELGRGGSDRAKNPLFQVIVDWDENDYGSLRLDGLEVEPLLIDAGISRADLSILIRRDSAGRLGASVTYDHASVDGGTVRRLVDAWLDAVGSAVGPSPPAAAGARCWHQLVEAQAAAHPATVALSEGDREVSYAELNQRADRLAGILRARGVEREAIVGVAARRSIELFVAILGVAKAGGAFLLLDGELPVERLRFMVDDAACRLVVGAGEVADRLAATGTEILRLDDELPATSAVDGGSAAPAPGPGDLAYVMYTSGSTGKPKGVLIEHAGLTNYLAYCVDAYIGDNGGWGTPVFSALAVDLTLTSMLPPLVAGQTVTIIGEHRDTGELVERLREHRGFSYVKVTPAHLEILSRALTPDECRTLCSTLVVGADALASKAVERWRAVAPRARVLNEYGPTEASVANSTFDIAGPVTSELVPIGTPIPNTTMYVLDDDGQPTPAGELGELHIGGTCVARGYLNRPELTAERFVPDPFSDDPDARMYRTGDLGRVLPDGSFTCLGRRDHQVKIRGYRVELGEVEATLRGHPDVAECAVGTHAKADGERVLVAYVVGGDHGVPTIGSVQRFLGARLPAYMVPAVLEVLEAMPLGVSGKLDRSTLPPPSATRPEVGARYEPPRSIDEEALASIWADLLELDGVGRNDDFFELGGPSLTASLVALRVHDELGVELPVQAVFQSPTVAELGADVAAVRGRLYTGARSTYHTSAATDLRRDARLSPEIRPPAPGRDAPRGDAADGVVVVTGAMSFIGRHLVDALLASTDRPVVCIVPGTRPDTARARLLEVLDAAPARDDRLAVVVGSIARPLLGLTPAEFETLGLRARTVYHFGELTQPLLTYENVRRTNVDGTVEALRLACLRADTDFHFLSTLDVVPPPRHGRLAGERFTAETDHLRGGFARSKWVGEELVRQAAERGLRAWVHRRGEVMGHSGRPVANHESVLLREIAASIRLGAIRSRFPSLPITPVDFVAAAVTAIATNAAPGVYHLVDGTDGRRSEHDQLADWLTELGHPVRRIGHLAWRRALTAAARREQDWPLLAVDEGFGYRDPENLLERSLYYARGALIRRRWRRHSYASDRTGGLLARAGVAPHPFDKELLGRCIDDLPAAWRSGGAE